ncbi:MAG: urease accessory protein UreF [Ancalomicrobiaceae bacterium]|nr:urease accessory protein UreF [Ancalomicrobiaceae bacterium]
MTSADPTVTEAGLMKLALWLSPAFPVGGFTYSHGLEWAIEDGSVPSAAALEAWLVDILDHGAGRNDAILFAHAWRAAATADFGALAAVAELADALSPTRERRLETGAQGTAFAKAISDTWGSPEWQAAEAGLRDRYHTIPWTYPVAVGTAAGCHGIALKPALALFLQCFVANIVSAGVRAIPLGQTDGLGIVSRLAPRALALADWAMTADLDAIGGATLRADIASMRHETQYTRLFRS